MVATGISNGEHVVEVASNTTTLVISVDGTKKDSQTLVGSYINNANAWRMFDGMGIPYINYFKVSVNGTQRLLFEPINIVNGPTLPDRSGYGNTGTINFGKNPVGINITVGGIFPKTEFVSPGGEGGEPPIVLPTPTEFSLREDVGATGAGLPLYDGVARMADSVGWSVPTTYVVLMLMASVGFGFGAMIATGTIWGFVIGFGGMAAAAGGATDSGGYHIMPWWIALLSVMFAIFIGYVWRLV